MSPFPSLGPTVAALPGVQALRHIVVLMMENRSFDHMLGFLGKPGMAGLSGSETNPDYRNVLQPVTRNAVDQGELYPDPSHEWEDTNEQIFGNMQGIRSGPTMQGFIKNYFRQFEDPKHSMNVMNCFRSDTLPILSGLAAGFGLCDHWFSSVPGPTLPNRAFVHFGTSFGDLKMSAALGVGQQNKSIYQRLANVGVSSRLYYSSASSSFAAILTDQQQFFGGMDDFFDTVRRNNPLPTYCFLEPSYSVPDDSDDQPNDQHPDNSVSAGEQLILKVYRAVWDNDNLRDQTLLIITYDEHGGLYDHVEPPAVPAESKPGEEGFAFDRLGIRVPAILVSPWIDATVVDSTQYDHASIPSTLTRMWIGDPAMASPGLREQQANTFLGNLNRATARPHSDDPLASHPDAEAFRLRIGAKLADTAPLLAARKMSSLVNLQVSHVAELDRKLPRSLQSDLDPRTLRTAGEAGSYIQQVTSAAQAHIASQRKKGESNE